MVMSSPAAQLSASGPAGKAALAAVVVAAMAASLAVEPSIGGLLAAALVPVLAAIAIIDARHYIIPDSLNALGALLGLAHAAATAPEPAEGLVAAILGGAGLALVFLAIRVGYGALRGRDGLGLGDVKLAAVAGIWLSVAAMPVVVEIAALAGLLAYGITRLAGRRAPRVRDRLPFGLFFAPAIWIGWLFDRWAVGLT